MKKINNKIKLVVWDLDETFWDGTLSEEKIIPIEKNIELVKKLTNRGIVNSICSKNNYDDVKKKLVELQLWDYFVFPQISWNPKGQVLKNLIEVMNLRQENVLFLDDNLLNLEEALYFLPKLNVLTPNYISTLFTHSLLIGKDDSSHSRLSQYKNLEKKHLDFEFSKLSNIDFLKESNIKVSIFSDSLNEIDRLHELVERTNQLNFTKSRVSKEGLIKEITEEGVKSGYISVTDKYGEYGISGFYLIKNNELKHFLFSCRTMNMFIESWLYKELGSPQLKVNGNVATPLNMEIDLSFISKNLKQEPISKIKDKLNRVPNVLMLGGCDLDQVVFYLNYKEMYTEFNYVNELNLNVHKDHTLLLKQFKNFKIAFEKVINNIPVLNIKDVNLKINSIDWSILIFSPLNDYSRGLYEHKRTGFILPFDSFNIDWTNEANWKEIPAHLKEVPMTFLMYLKKEFKFLGPISPEQFKKNIEWLLDTYKKKKFIFLTGSELEFNKGKLWEKNMHLRHKQMNDVLMSFEMNDNVKLIKVNDVIKDLSFMTDNIRHYTKLGYKLISDKIIFEMKDWVGEEITANNKLKVLFKKTLNKIKQL